MKRFIIILVSLLVIAAGCSSQQSPPEPTPSQPNPAPEPSTIPTPTPESRLEVKVPDYSEVILPNYPAPFDNPYMEVRKSILNPVNSVNLKDLVKDLKKERYRIVVTDLNGESIKINKNKVALVIGSEAKGVSKKVKELADINYKIQKFGKAESLNVGVATGIVMNKIKIY